MDNTEYIKSLEERIEKLENFINGIKLENNDNISFLNCQFQGIAFEKCKNVSVEGLNAEGVAFASFNANIENATLNSLIAQSGIVKIKNCDIQNIEEKNK